MVGQGRRRGIARQRPAAGQHDRAARLRLPDRHARQPGPHRAEEDRRVVEVVDGGRTTRHDRARDRAGPPRRRRPGFKRAWEAQDIDALIGLLDPDATAVADGDGLAVTFAAPVEGGEPIARAWLEFARRGPETMTFSERTANGRPGLVAEQGGAVVTVFAFQVVGDRITRIWVVRNPEELRHRTAA
ncbi:hypothetical protein [Streptomyces solaniscabiei]|uniref:hypothetical protein n=1 Tax=Streptomyces solaniscabiei TaxID=2683255 RepID=UPI001CE35A13|nr:hypothetical protein [Streptomyces solaniscabiei]